MGPSYRGRSCDVRWSRNVQWFALSTIVCASTSLLEHAEVSIRIGAGHSGHEAPTCYAVVVGGKSVRERSEVNVLWLRLFLVRRRRRIGRGEMWRGDKNEEG